MQEGRPVEGEASPGSPTSRCAYGDVRTAFQVTFPEVQSSGTPPLVVGYVNLISRVIRPEPVADNSRPVTVPESVAGTVPKEKVTVLGPDQVYVNEPSAARGKV
jgi:hypothetical protein